MIRSEHLDVYDVRLTTRAPLFIGSGIRLSLSEGHPLPAGQGPAAG